MPRLPSPINWIRSGSNSNDLLMTMDIPPWVTNLEQDIRHSQVMTHSQVKDFLYQLVNSACDRFELQTVEIPMRDEDGDFVRDEDAPYGSDDKIYEEVERFVPNPLSIVDAIYFRGVDRESKDDDVAFKLNYYRKPDADLEAFRNKCFATIDKYLTPPLQLTEITCYGQYATDLNPEKEDPFARLRFNPLNPIDLDEFFDLE